MCRSRVRPVGPGEQALRDGRATTGSGAKMPFPIGSIVVEGARTAARGVMAIQAVPAVPVDLGAEVASCSYIASTRISVLASTRFRRRQVLAGLAVQEGQVVRVAMGARAAAEVALVRVVTVGLRAHRVPLDPVVKMADPREAD